jgi:hypothetical protein
VTLGDSNQLLHVALSRAKPVGRGEQSTTDGDNSPTLFLTEISVATAHREPIWFTNGWHGDDLDRKI